ncbi:MFS transporter [Saccharopolyspora sp. WRP15-2]|uniref:MFS transporter n=1 Tax=Saccharopolyspora oryzae TaxID=2997343 RepID=A0ABT4UZ15_9PSEU|nr:MFS transporter [Saccharopolyspora oryzae]MDA3626954.1 MFS transporter [Saccharopolyspora oryzae]
MTDISQSTQVDAPARAGAGRWRTVFGTGIGNALEWYDWNVYAVFAPFFASQFFPKSDATSALLSTLAIFAVGFLMRPLGGLFFGWLGDRKGRRTAMVASIAMAAGGSLVIGIAPTYDTIGIGASLLLLLARLGQGLAHGGELPAAQTYVSEMAPPGRRGRWSSLIYVSGTIGITVGTALGAVLASALVPAELAAWGWRIPFVVGGIIGVYALVMRMRLAETEAFEHDDAARTKISLWQAFWQNRIACLKVIGLTLGGTVVYYTWFVAAPAQAISVKGFDPSATLWVAVAANVVFICALPFFGALSDKIGRKPVLQFAFIGGAVLTFPLNWLVQDQVWQLAAAMFIAMLFMAPASAILPAVYAEMFPTHVRTTGVAIPYAIAVAACGGSAPYLQTWLTKAGAGSVFLTYTVALLLLAVLVVRGMPETKDVDLT